MDWQVPNAYIASNNDLKGINADLGRAFGSFLGFDTWADFNKSKNTQGVKHDIAFINKSLPKNEQYPVNGSEYEQSNWLEKHTTSPMNSTIHTRPAVGPETEAVTKDGRVLAQGTIHDQEGNVVTDKSVFDKNADGNKTILMGIVDTSSGLPPGTIMVQDPDGKMYSIEQTSLKVINTEAYGEQQILGAISSSTGRRTITLKYKARGIPRGTYEVSQEPNGIYFKQGGKVTHIRYTRDGKTMTKTLNK